MSACALNDNYIARTIMENFQYLEEIDANIDPDPFFKSNKLLEYIYFTAIVFGRLKSYTRNR